MLKVMLQKLRHKPWMGLALFVGIMLLIATTVSFPMYRAAAYDRMLQDEFDQYLAENGSWPARNRLSLTSKKERGGTSIGRMEGLMEEIHGRLGVTELAVIQYYSVGQQEAESELHRDDVDKFSLRISYMTELDRHVRLKSGEMYSDSGISEDGCLEAVISEACMVETGLLLGETVDFLYLKDPAGEPIRLRVVGVFEGADDEADGASGGVEGAADSGPTESGAAYGSSASGAVGLPGRDYWQFSPESLHNNCMIREDLFREYFTDEQAGRVTLQCFYYPLWDYRELKAGDVDRVISETRYYIEESPFRNTFSDPPYLPLLERFQRKQLRIDAALILLQTPVWILLAAFLFMISSQMYDLERNEISVMKSRGSSGLQIFLLYLYQSVFMVLLGAAAGLPLGRLFAKALGAAGSFLEFRSGRTLTVSYTREAFVYGLAAMAGCVLVITIPALKHSRLSIVGLKQQKTVRRRAWWELCCLDLILLGVSLYEYFVFSGKLPEIEANAFLGEPMEPLLYISSSLFVVGLGLLLIRLQPLLVGLIYRIGKRFWGPAAYISFMENAKNGRKQQFIMLFLIISISLGIFHSVTARTILQNARENTAYLDGADRIVKEIWRDNSGVNYEGEAAELQYYEPDFEKYARLPQAASWTKVLYDEKGALSGGEHNGQKVAICGIHTKQFGENTVMPQGLLEKHYYEYLNELAAEPEGALLSANFRDLLGYQVGDKISFSNVDRMRMECTVLDFVDYWPGYAPSVMTQNPDGTVAVTAQYLIVANIDSMNKEWGVVPYEVWVTDAAKDDGPGGSAAAFSEWLEAENVKLAKYVNRRDDIEAAAEDPLLQGTNGILTMGFLMTMILCASGYLIYWILSIRSRELIFGILRANGMHRGEIFHILINEQIFCGGFAVAAGTLTGLLASHMFVPILQTAYAASDQVLPLRLITRQQDMARLYGVIGVMLLICLIVLVTLVRKLDVAKALKLGEE